MEQKTKSVSFILNLLKSAIKGVIVSIILVLGLAFLLKFVNMSNKLISVFDEIIKGISIFISVKSFLKVESSKTIIKAFVVGMIYTLLTFILFSALKGSYNFSVGTIFDILLGGVVGTIFAVIINIFSKEKIRA